jgi:site-specific DNA-cytosine methylase
MDFDGILSAVEAHGYETRVFSIPACAVGSPHRRERYWIVAHRDGERLQEQRGAESVQATNGQPECGGQGDVSHTESDLRGASGHDGRIPFDGAGPWGDAIWLPCADGKLRRAPDDSFGVVDGLHRSVLAALGNSIVPQVAERIIAAMIAAEI